jgi:hypothetical protein
MADDIELPAVAMTAREMVSRLRAKLDPIMSIFGESAARFAWEAPARDSKLIAEHPNGRLLAFHESTTCRHHGKALTLSLSWKCYEGEPPLFFEVALAMVGGAVIQFGLTAVEKPGKPIVCARFHAGMISDEKAEALRRIFEAALGSS